MLSETHICFSRKSLGCNLCTFAPSVRFKSIFSTRLFFYNALELLEYKTAVSAGINTRFSERQVISLFSVAIDVLLIPGFWMGKLRKI